MNIVNAIWEERNINKKTLEIFFEKKDYELKPKDILDKILNAQKKHEAQYVVIKLLAGHPEIDLYFQKNMFYKIETQIGLVVHKEDAVKSINTYKKIFSNISYVSYNSDLNIAHIKNEIKRGIFTTDRIAVDPKLGIELANRRYVNWLQDEINRGAELFCILNDQQKIGFFLSKKNTSYVDALLGGIFVDFKQKNYGSSMAYCAIKEFVDSKYEKMYTGVSSNNIVILKLHELFGYRVRLLTDVFIRHF